MASAENICVQVTLYIEGCIPVFRNMYTHKYKHSHKITRFNGRRGQKIETKENSTLESLKEGNCGRNNIILISKHRINNFKLIKLLTNIFIDINGCKAISWY